MSKARRDTKCIRCWVRWIRTGELAGAMRPRALLAAGNGLPHHLGFQRTRALGRKLVGLLAARLVLHDLDHLRDHVAGALDRHRVADPHAEPLDLVLIVQGGVLHHHAADGDRFELRHRRQRAGAADLDLDVADAPSRPSRRRTCAPSPSAACARRSRAAPASRAGRLCRPRRRCRIRAWRARARSHGEIPAALRSSGRASISG